VLNQDDDFRIQISDLEAWLSSLLK